VLPTAKASVQTAFRCLPAGDGLRQLRLPTTPEVLKLTTPDSLPAKDGFENGSQGLQNQGNPTELTPLQPLASATREVLAVQLVLRKVLPPCQHSFKCLQVNRLQIKRSHSAFSKPCRTRLSGRSQTHRNEPLQMGSTKHKHSKNGNFHVFVSYCGRDCIFPPCPVFPTRLSTLRSDGLHFQMDEYPVECG
jgi:hypothetical protein